MRLVIDTDPTVIDILGAPQVEERAAEIVIPQPRDIAATRTLNLQVESTDIDLQFRAAFENQNRAVARMSLSIYGIVCQSHISSRHSSMPTRNLVLTEHQTAFVERLVTSGRYQNASEVLREGLRLIERRESEDEMRLAALRDAAKVGIADIDTGNFRSFDSEEKLGQHLATLASGVIGA